MLSGFRFLLCLIISGAVTASLLPRTIRTSLEIGWPPFWWVDFVWTVLIAGATLTLSRALMRKGQWRRPRLMLWLAAGVGQLVYWPQLVHKLPYFLRRGEHVLVLDGALTTAGYWHALLNACWFSAAAVVGTLVFLGLLRCAPPEARSS